MTDPVYEVYSNKENDISYSYNILANVFCPDRQDVANELYHNSYNLYFQLLSSQINSLIITYMSYHIYAITHICVSAYSIYMNTEIKNIFEKFVAQRQMMEEEIAPKISELADLMGHVCRNMHITMDKLQKMLEIPDEE